MENLLFVLIIPSPKSVMLHDYFSVRCALHDIDKTATSLPPGIRAVIHDGALGMLPPSRGQCIPVTSSPRLCEEETFARKPHPVLSAETIYKLRGMHSTRAWPPLEKDRQLSCLSRLQATLSSRCK